MTSTHTARFLRILLFLFSHWIDRCAARTARQRIVGFIFFDSLFFHCRYVFVFHTSIELETEWKESLAVDSFMFGTIYWFSRIHQIFFLFVSAYTNKSENFQWQRNQNVSIDVTREFHDVVDVRIFRFSCFGRDDRLPATHFAWSHSRFGFPRFFDMRMSSIASLGCSDCRATSSSSSRSDRISDRFLHSLFVEDKHKHYSSFQLIVMRYGSRCNYSAFGFVKFTGFDTELVLASGTALHRWF